MYTHMYTHIHTQANLTAYYASFACILRALFRPSPLTLAAADTAEARLFSGALAASGPYTPVLYTAFHFRTGGSHGEEMSAGINPGKFKHSRLKLLMAGSMCARSLAVRFAIDVRVTPVLLATDLNALRRYVASGLWPLAVSPGYDAYHLDMSVGTNTSDVRAIFTDIYLLARARCLVTGYMRSPSGRFPFNAPGSGLSHVAVALGGALSGRLCWQSLPKCVSDTEHLLEFV